MKSAGFWHYGHKECRRNHLAIQSLSTSQILDKVTKHWFNSLHPKCVLGLEMDFRVLFYFIFLEFVGVVIVGIITFFF